MQALTLISSPLCLQKVAYGFFPNVKADFVLFCPLKSLLALGYFDSDYVRFGALFTVTQNLGFTIFQKSTKLLCFF